MYGNDKPQVPWNTPPRSRTTPAGGDEVESSARRFSPGMNYFGLDGSESSATSGGFTQVPRSGGHARSESAGHNGSGGSEGNIGGAGQVEKTHRDKVNQIVQAFFWKAAMVIIQGRMAVTLMLSPKTGEPKTNRWFNIELDEMETFRDELRLWRVGDSFDPRPPPLVIETYLDTNDLTATQALVILDSEEKRWNVTEALENAANRAGLNIGLRRGDRGTGKAQQIVLERWKIELRPPYDVARNPELPVVYKKGIILFRSLYSYISLMPTWKFRRRLAKLKLHKNTLKIGCRVSSGDELTSSARRWDGLQVPLYPGDDKVTDDYSFGKVESPAGYLNISVSFRQNCDFRVDDSEALLSSHFINLDEHYFRPSTHQRTASQPSAYTVSRGTEYGTLPAAATAGQRPEYNTTYGSLSSFHQAAGPTSASPISTLRNAAEAADRASPNASPAEKPPGPRSIQGSKSSLRSVEAGASRRGSLSFQPFKSPSLSASPATSDQPGSSVGRVATPVTQAHRQRFSAGTVPSPFRPPQPSGDADPMHAPIPIASNSPKPQPMARITSSFGSRRPRVSSVASVTRTDDDNSSGHGSYVSSGAAPGSGLYSASAAPGGRSFEEEDLQIRDFMSLLADGQRTSLKSFGRSSSSTAESSVRRSGNPLSKFQRMKDSQSVLAESMTSSLLMQPPSSPTTASGTLSNVPPMVPSSTFSSSSSPGKPLSPHTPHTPAVPSRLSEGLTAQYAQRDQPRRRRVPSPSASEPEGRNSNEEAITDGTATTSPLDIPLSPRIFGPRRALSMSQQPRDDIDGSGSIDYPPMNTAFDSRRHSVSLGSVEMAPLSMSRQRELRDASESPLTSREAVESGSHQAQEEDEALAFETPVPPSMEGDGPRYAQRFNRVSGSSPSSYRGRFYASSRGRGDTPTGSNSSIDRALTSNTRASQGVVGRRTPSWSRPNPEDEDLLFAMSDMMVAQHSRRSLDQDNRVGSDTSGVPARRRSRGAGVGDAGRGGW